MKYLSRNEARAIDKKAMEVYGVPGIVLMENAGRGIAEYILSLKPQGKITICCGKGNNGGDGYVIARHLDNHNLPIEILCFATPEDIQGDARINYDIAVNAKLPLTHVQNTDTDLFTDSAYIIDGLLGSGLQGEVQAPFDGIINAINQAHKKVLAIDIPSGLDCDTGQPLGTAIHADHTLTMVAPKQGFTASEAKSHVGQVEVVDIGLPRLCLS